MGLTDGLAGHSAQSIPGQDPIHAQCRPPPKERRRRDQSPLPPSIPIAMLYPSTLVRRTRVRQLCTEINYIFVWHDGLDKLQVFMPTLRKHWRFFLCDMWSLVVLHVVLSPSSSLTLHACQQCSKQGHWRLPSLANNPPFFSRTIAFILAEEESHTTRFPTPKRERGGGSECQCPSLPSPPPLVSWLGHINPALSLAFVGQFGEKRLFSSLFHSPVNLSSLLAWQSVSSCYYVFPLSEAAAAFSIPLPTPLGGEGEETGLCARATEGRKRFNSFLRGRHSQKLQLCWSMNAMFTNLW